MNKIKTFWQSARRSRTLFVIWTFSLICGICIPAEVIFIGGIPGLLAKDPLWALLSFAPVLFFAGMLVEGLKMSWQSATNFDKPIDNIFFWSISCAVVFIFAIQVASTAVIGEKRTNEAMNKVAGAAFEVMLIPTGTWFLFHSFEKEVGRVKQELDKIDLAKGCENSQKRK